ncbi:hypothetical protein [Nocardiopsis lucentensis]|uniref:hypothetical protein n=1 Tax=Nocardiopsis lucentensis TaxID=53441 RepID=UPI0003609C94|nr:hypothetical protein [Nocardiopsis lucentensis]
MYIERFVAHHTPTKARIFALTIDSNRGLQAVTTLSGAQTQLTEDLVDALNLRLFEGREDDMNGVLERLPEPVQTAARRFFHDAGKPDPHRYTDMGPISVVRHLYFTDNPEELVEFLDAAYMMGFGVRVSNEVQSDGDIGWSFEMRSEEVFVPASAEPRSWPLPEDMQAIRTWTSREPTGGHPARAAFAIAHEASQHGRYVRIHTFAHGSSDDPEDTLTSEFAVDVFDAPIPPSEEEE